MKGLSLDTDRPEDQELISYGLATFDNIFLGFITSLVMVTMEGWSKVMYNLTDATNPSLAIFGCTTLVVICGFFLVNIILAVLAESVSNENELDDQNIVM